MTGMFEHIASVDEEGRLASRKATVVANMRVDAKLSAFVMAGRDTAEREARLSLVEDDLAGLVTVACEENGATNHVSIIDAIKNRLLTAGKDDDKDDKDKKDDKKGDKKDKKKEPNDDDDGEFPFWKKDSSRTAGDEEDKKEEDEAGRCSDCGKRIAFPYGKGKDAACDCDWEKDSHTASTHESRKPKVCPYHREVMDISLAQGEPRAGFDAMAQHAWSSNHCQGGEYEGARCNFKRDMVTQAYWDEKTEQATQRAEERAERALQAEVPAVSPAHEEPVAPLENPLVPEETEQEPYVPGDPAAEPINEPNAEVPMAMAAKVAFNPTYEPPSGGTVVRGIPNHPRIRCPHCGDRNGGPGLICGNCGGEIPDDKSPHEAKTDAVPLGGSQKHADGFNGLGKEKRCPTCNRSVPMGATKCAECGGKIKKSADFGPFGDGEMNLGTHGAGQECPHCGGTGAIHGDTCPNCHGQGDVDPAHPSVNNYADRGPARTVPYGDGEMNLGIHGIHAETLKTVDLMEGGADPIPKIDKRKWTPETVPFIDAEMEGSKHPTVHQDILEPINYDGNDPLEGAKAGLERQDVTKKVDPQKGGPTKTWKSKLAFEVAPVESRPCPTCGGKGSGPCQRCKGTGAIQQGTELGLRPDGAIPQHLTAVDPDKNPISSILEDEGFIPQLQVQAAVQHTK